MKIQLDTRQRHVLHYFLESDAYETLAAAAERLSVSVRTLQREMNELESFLAQYGLAFDKRSGVGVKLLGEPEARNRLREYIDSGSWKRTYASEERQTAMKRMILASSEPTKLYAFSRTFDVAEATVSADLNKIEYWFEKYGIRLVRKPGVGVYRIGSEKQIRTAMADLLYEHVRHEELVEYMYIRSRRPKDKLETAIRERLLNFIDPEWLTKIEQAIQESESKWGFRMPDNAYVGFVVHLALAVQRLTQHEEITIERDVLRQLKDCEEYALAAELAGALSERLGLVIPDSEIGYITMHILGSRSRHPMGGEWTRESAMRYVGQMIAVMEQELKLNLEGDETLFENLTTHLTSAVQRIKLGMAIRNPLLDHVKREYPLIFEATRKAAAAVEKQIGAPVPEEEVGYLAMHFGSAILRKTEMPAERCRVLLVCSSGIGTSRLLAVQLERKLPRLHIVDTVSLFHLESWLAGRSPIDLIISTMPIPDVARPVVVVNPFLPEEDIRLIERHVGELRPEPRPYAEKRESIDQTVGRVESFGKALAELNDGIAVFEAFAADGKAQCIERAAALIQTRFDAADADALRRDIELRESQGPLLLEEERIAMLHCRSSSVSRTCVCVLKLKEALAWESTDDRCEVQTVLVLVIPAQASKECYELMSQVSVALADDAFVRLLQEGNSESIAEGIRYVLKKGYVKLAGEALRA